MRRNKEVKLGTVSACVIALLAGLARGFIGEASAADSIGASPAASTAKVDADILDSARHGDAGHLSFVLGRGGNANVTDGSGLAALALALLSSHADAAEALLDAGAAIDRPLPHHATLLHYVARVNSARLTERLIAGGLPVNQRDDYGNTALIAAASQGALEGMQVLINHGALTYPLDATGQSALVAARKFAGDPAKQAAMIALLLKNGAPADGKNRPQDEAFLKAVKAGAIAPAKAALTAGADINARQCEPGTSCGTAGPLVLAVANSPMTAFLIETGANVMALTAYDFTPLHFAACDGKPQSIELLIKNGANPEAKTKTGDTPLYAAINCNHPANVQALLSLGADPNAISPSAGQSLLAFARRPARSTLIAPMLERAGGLAATPEGAPKPGCHLNATPVQPCELLAYAEIGHTEAVKRSLARGIDVNYRGEKGESALMLALLIPLSKAALPPELQNDQSFADLVARKRRTATFLIEHGADVKARSIAGTTALHFVAENPASIDFLMILLRKGADVNALGGPNHVSPLISAVEKRNTAGMTALLDAGADPNLAMVRNITPLMAACLDGNAEAVALLLKRGANPAIPNTRGETPLNVAEQNQRRDLIDLLRKTEAVTR